MNMDISNRLIRIGNYFYIGMPLYYVTDNGAIKSYILTKIEVNILNNDYMTTVFVCTDESDNNEYFTFDNIDRKELFIDKTHAENQACVNALKYWDS